jgi:hypothetical protein
MRLFDDEGRTRMVMITAEENARIIFTLRPVR